MTTRTEFPTLSAPALRALHNAGYTHLEQLTTVTEKQLAGLHGMGPKGLRLLREALTAAGLSFAAG
jgi:hypothetical protein